VVVTDAEAHAPRRVVLARESLGATTTLDAVILDRVFGNAAIERVDLDDAERRVLFTAKGTTVALPLDARSPARRLTTAEVARIEQEREGRATGGDGAFSTTDGELFTRTADGVGMRPEGCWFPEGWGDESLVRIRVLAGNDALDGHLLDRDRVASLYCSASRFEAFLRGDPMPPRPDARWTEPQPTK
jgi:hypothetical protein